MELFETLKNLSLCNGPSGSEAAVGEAVITLLAPLVDQVGRDRLQNVIGLRRCGKPNAKKLLIDAHLDEIGFIITGVEEAFCAFKPLAEWMPECCLPGR